MDKLIPVVDKVVIKKVVELPLSNASGLFAESCKACVFCTVVALTDDPNASCPFVGRSCDSITKEDWEEYLNGD